VKGRLGALPPRAQIAIAVGAVVLYAAALWFLLVAPKRSAAAAASEEVAMAQVQLAEAQVAARRPARAAPSTGASDVLRLAKAMPSSADQAGLVLELDRLAGAANLTITSISPGDEVVTPGSPTSIPVVVEVTGTYRQVTRFLQHARALVSFRRGVVTATGRLLTVQSVEVRESTAKGFPYLDATVTLNSFVYDGPIAQAPPPPPTTGDTSTGATAAGSPS
jgi:Tfp pilus assembly protein PilO